MRTAEVFDHCLVGDGCWEWQRARMPRGYGKGKFDGRYRYAHQVAWEVWNEQSVPDGLGVRHTCDNPPCIRPDHLLIGTQQDNMDDYMERGRPTHCPAGHEYVEGNIYWEGKYRRCLTCISARKHRQYLRRKAQA